MDDSWPEPIVPSIVPAKRGPSGGLRRLDACSRPTREFLPALPRDVTKPTPPPPINTGTVCNDRYEIRQSLGKGGMGEVFLAFDRSTQQTVALKVVREESRMPGDDEALRQELLLARSVGHPNVCRVHDLAPSLWGPILVMEQIPGQTLHTHIRKKKAQGGYSSDEFRRIASEVCAGLAAIHAQGLVHGDLKPGNVMVSDGRAVILDFGFAQERARASARRPGAPPDGGTPNYMSPERLRSGGASAEDDVYAMALTLWEMWTCRVPEPAYKPRQKTMRSQIMFDVPAGLSIDEVRQIFRGMNEDPQMRPQARHMRFFNPTQLTTSPIALPRERLDPGPPLGRAQQANFTPGAQSLLVTYATNAPEVVGTLLPLDKPVITIGRRGDQDLVIPEATVSGTHSVLRWQQGSWIVEDLGSTNGSYADHHYERKTQVAMMHGGESQVGECRIKLVSFAPDSMAHKRARQYLGKRDGLTGLLVREHLMKAPSATGPRRPCRSPATSCAAPTARSASGPPSWRCWPCAARPSASSSSPRCCCSASRPWSPDVPARSSSWSPWSAPRSRRRGTSSSRSPRRCRAFCPTRSSWPPRW
jgi:serine/threonine protein kinase